VCGDVFKSLKIKIMRSYFVIIYKKRKAFKDPIEVEKIECYHNPDTLIQNLERYINTKALFTIYAADCVCDLS